MEPFTIFDHEKKLQKIKNINEFINTENNCFFKDNDIGLIKLNNIYFTRLNAYDYKKNINFSFGGYSRGWSIVEKDIYSEIKSKLKIKNNYIGNFYYFDFVCGNYFHCFIDTFPYIYQFIYFKKYIPDLKLLISVNQPTFVYDFINFYVNKDNIFLWNKSNCEIKTLYLGTFKDHKNRHNRLGMRDYILFNIYTKILNDSLKLKDETKLYDRIYISRRSWANKLKNKKNIGQDNTQSRKCLNEDELVNLLTTKYNFKEIFAENYTFQQKAKIYNNAKYIFIQFGASIINMIFASKNCKSVIFKGNYFIFKIIDIIYREKNIKWKLISGKADGKKNNSSYTINMNDLDFLETYFE